MPLEKNGCGVIFGCVVVEAVNYRLHFGSDFVVKT